MAVIIVNQSRTGLYAVAGNLSATKGIRIKLVDAQLMVNIADKHDSFEDKVKSIFHSVFEGSCEPTSMTDLSRGRIEINFNI
jgi:hypothetical protein